MFLAVGAMAQKPREELIVGPQVDYGPRFHRKERRDGSVKSSQAQRTNVIANNKVEESTTINTTINTTTTTTTNERQPGIG